jgi:asparagine synthetase B (glutamine-hydrolysing)
MKKLSKELKIDNYSKDGFLASTRQAVINGLKRIEGRIPAIMISGGVDSSILAILCREANPNTLFFTIGTNYEHPDIIAGLRLAKEIDLNLRVYIPSKHIIEQAQKMWGSTEYLQGNESEYLLLNEISKHTIDVLCTDGIDELMGGYWEHYNWLKKQVPIEFAFDKYWSELETQHLYPLRTSAEKVGVNVDFVFKDNKFMEYISHIPLEDRVKIGEGKILWKEIARMIGVPEWVIQRKKLGFCDSLQEIKNVDDYYILKNKKKQDGTEKSK